MNARTFALLPLLIAACATGEKPRPTAPVQVETTSRNIVPAGTQFAIEVDEEIDTTEPVTDRTFRARFAQPIVNQNRQEIVPADSPAELIVVRVDDDAGAFGTPAISLAIRSVTVNGRRHLIQTGEEEREGREGVGINRRTGAFVGGGALLGTVVGGVIGGTRGAVLGGVLGGLAGAGTQVLTRGDKVQVPAGTILEFRLDDEWRLLPTEQRPTDRPIS